jgi:hypothetical protein
MIVVNIIGIMAVAFVILCCLVVLAGIVGHMFAFHNPEKAKEKPYMDNSEYDWGHNVKYNSEE